MDEEPDEPGNDPAEFEVAQAGDGLAAANGGHRAGIFVGKGMRRLPAKESNDVAGGVIGLLHGNRGHHWQRTAIGTGQQSGITDDEGIGEAFYLQGRLHRDPAEAALLDTQGAHHRGGFDARGPYDSLGSDGRAILEGDVGAIEIGHGRAKADFDVLFLQYAEGILAEFRGESGQEFVEGFKKNDLHAADIHVGIVFGEHQMRKLRERAGGLDAGGAAAHDHKGQHGLTNGRIGFLVGQLEHGEQVIAYRSGIADVLQPKSVAFERLHAKELGHSARSQDESVEGNVAGAGMQYLAGQIHTAHLAQNELKVLLAAQNAAHRMGDLIR